MNAAEKARRLAGGIRRVSLCALLVAMATAAGRSARADGEAAEMANDDPAPGEAPAGPDTQVGVQGDSYADTDPSALTDFRPALDPHGAWVDDPTYGTVWVPNSDEVGTDFRPYVSAGHWAYDDDYAWVSDYEWGWVAFHYGRWVWATGRGWAWIAGREYAGAWVGWRMGDADYAYVGWAPLAPVWGWRDGVAGALGFASREPYVFCPSRDVFSPSVATRLAGTDQASVIAAHTRPYAAPPAARVAARPVVQSKPHGPAPALLGIEPSQVARLTRSEPSVLRARQFAKPSTALALGAHPPVAHYVRAGMAARPVTVREPPTRPSVKKK